MATFANIPGQFTFVPEGWRLRFEHYVEPKGEYFPTISHAEFSPIIAIISLIVAAVAAGAAVAYYRRAEAEDPMATELANGPPARAASRRSATRCWPTSSTWTGCTPTSSSAS
ncbi:MAG: hypothetical protein R2749_02505 [Acidimicrobiales bacterium]